MPFVAIMDATLDNRVAKFQAFSTEVAAAAHVARFTGRWPDAFVAPEPVEPFPHWIIDMVAKTITAVSPPLPEPAATGAQMIDEAKSRNKLAALLTALTASERAMLYTRRRIVADSNFARVLRTKLGVTAPAMASFIAAAANRSEE